MSLAGIIDRYLEKTAKPPVLTDYHILNMSKVGYVWNQQGKKPVLFRRATWRGGRITDK